MSTPTKDALRAKDAKDASHHDEAPVDLRTINAETENCENASRVLDAAIETTVAAFQAYTVAMKAEAATITTNMLRHKENPTLEKQLLPSSRSWPTWTLKLPLSRRMARSTVS
jgi:hypothetical protein